MKRAYILRALATIAVITFAARPASAQAAAQPAAAATAPTASATPWAALPTGTYQIRDGTNVTRGADGTINPTNPALLVQGNDGTSTVVSRGHDWCAAGMPSNPARAMSPGTSSRVERSASSNASASLSS